MTTTKQLGTCPVCEGSGRSPVPEDCRQWLPPQREHPLIAGWDAETDTLPCENCGGQTMSLKGTGQVPLRPDGTPCVHEYKRGPDDGRWRCYHQSECIHCGFTYAIDSGD